MAGTAGSDHDGLACTGLHGLHVELGAKMVPFAGYDMPVSYPMGVLREHLHTRAAAGLFDVGHMGQVILRGPDRVAALERLVPADIAGLAEGRQRYALFTTPEGGILDDLMVANRGDHLFLVVNAANKAADLAHLAATPGLEVTPVTDRGLLALQGPQAEAALARLVPGVAAMRFMDVASLDWQGAELWISRSGYTGEDGFEISVPAAAERDLARALLDQPEVAPIGLGARDSLRLEAGLPLHGHDIDTTTTPVEAALGWSIGKARRTGPRAGGFPGADRILAELETGAPRRRLGLRPEGRAPMREGTPLFDAPEGGRALGQVASGGFGPSLEAPLAMALLPADIAPGAQIWGEVRGKRQPAQVVSLPFVPSRFKR
ncbi:glycine cleavage system aminomethyltransferase GcvT [Phaeovulum vinaykumarii]|uniref:aminomethyltransferase n=1 Tax=Phaeovulum vinaykumarii TaxID=407234 RepID=A0A1N7LU85_9RHOB|nr:glycine cleavage system aminomethyltransferase GcvT [Phaeovulum vinaykumarii]SIS77271.1 aminomethyltransferase [Phaeovulum vinaykumarii]SOC07507.1 aminomethyltransferase [Phaeovulum vinaykumarii]